MQYIGYFISCQENAYQEPNHEATIRHPQCKILCKTTGLHSSKKVIIKGRKKASDYSRLKQTKRDTTRATHKTCLDPK